VAPVGAEHTQRDEAGVCERMTCRQRFGMGAASIETYTFCLLQKQSSSDVAQEFCFFFALKSQKAKTVLSFNR
jgi:hypothetical protein